MQHGPHVLAAAHVVVALRAVDAVRGRDLGLAVRALDPLLGGLVLAHRGLGELLAEVAQVLDEAERRAEDWLGLSLLAQHDRRKALEVAVPLLDQLQLLVAEAEPVLLHLVLAIQVLPVGELERQAHGRAAELAREQGGGHLADELEGLLGLGHLVGAVDLLQLFEHLAQALGAPEGLQRLDLLGGRAAWTNANAKAAGLDLLARNLRIPQRKDVARIRRAHGRRSLRCGHKRIGREMRFK